MILSNHLQAACMGGLYASSGHGKQGIAFEPRVILRDNGVVLPSEDQLQLRSWSEVNIYSGCSIKL
jgi:hypothetical protein